MKKKNNVISVIALVCAVSALAVSLMALSASFREGSEQEVYRALAQENAALREALDTLSARVDGLSAETDGNAYCTMILNDWTADSQSLTLTSGYLFIRLSDGAGLTVENARLVLSRGGVPVDSRQVEVLPGEGDGSYEAALNGQFLSLPALSEDDVLELALVVKLSNGQTLRSETATWHCSGGSLYAAVG